MKINCPLCHEDVTINPPDSATSFHTIAPHPFQHRAWTDEPTKIVTVQIWCIAGGAKVIE